MNMMSNENDKLTLKYQYSKTSSINEEKNLTDAPRKLKQ